MSLNIMGDPALFEQEVRPQLAPIEATIKNTVPDFNMEGFLEQLQTLISQAELTLKGVGYVQQPIVMKRHVANLAAQVEITEAAAIEIYNISIDFLGNMSPRINVDLLE
jgi:hypothetical protein